MYVRFHAINYYGCRVHDTVSTSFNSLDKAIKYAEKFKDYDVRIVAYKSYDSHEVIKDMSIKATIK